MGPTPSIPALGIRLRVLLRTLSESWGQAIASGCSEPKICPACPVWAGTAESH